ncbi:Hypothetical_protein [Hexamita inflata]|uniref:Hypothetical_protein n=1 Tax=Hexamita inflata TaxID=28002 RepID=A0AA86NW04_9EUKA|nr:Hypothetical protein HINF_LOCUS14539 [Hexamita inflata]
MVNGSCIQVTCPIQGQFSINGICQCTNINSFIQDQACVCPSSSTLVGNTCTCTQIGNSIINNTCKKTSQVILNTDNTVMCSQQVSLTTYEVVSTVIYSLMQSNFSSGYVFSSTTIQNAMIDITDNTYSTAQPLFQSQSSFEIQLSKLELKPQMAGRFYQQAVRQLLIRLTQCRSRVQAQIQLLGFKSTYYRLHLLVQIQAVYC